MKHTYEELVKDNRNKRKALSKMQKELEVLRQGVAELATHRKDKFDDFVSAYSDIKIDARILNDMAKNIRGSKK